MNALQHSEVWERTAKEFGMMATTTKEAHLEEAANNLLILSNFAMSMALGYAEQALKEK